MRTALVLLFAVAATVPTGVTASAGVHLTTILCGGGFALTDTPSSGSAPLLVSFELSGPYTNSTAVSWDFGDGSYLNGSGPDFTFAARSYTRPGAFNASVTAGDPASPIARCSSVVTVQPGPLAVGFIASVYSGPAPLTIQFTGTISGGSGVYRSELWSFGDGSNGTGLNASYTFQNPGSYRVVWTVADSSGTQGETSHVITVGAAAAPQSGLPGGSGLGDVTGWIVLGVGIAVALVALGYYGLSHRRTLARQRRPPDGYGPVPPAGAILRSDTSGVPEPGPQATGAEVGVGPPIPVLASSPGPRPGPTRAVGVAVLQTSQRVIAHLARQGAPPMAPLGTRPLTQVGISEALSIEQSNLTRILQRLELAGMVNRDLRHVPGVARRVRIYMLTPAGQRIAAGIARHSMAPRTTTPPFPEEADP